MKLSANFYLEEFTSRKLLLPVQIYMLQTLCSNLELMREICESRIKIVGGMRSYDDYISLQNKGLNPSETSDHFFGEVIPLNKDKNIKKYGKWYTQSVGAADIEFLDKKTEIAFRMIIDNRNRFETGQIILEKHNTFWVHISNHPSLIYSDYISETYLEKQPYLVSLDNGQTFQDAIAWLRTNK